MFEFLCGHLLKRNYEKSAGEVRKKVFSERIFFTYLLILILTTRSVSPGQIWAIGKEWNTKGEITKATMPEFEDTGTEIVIAAGRAASLPCKIRNIGDRLVSWIRTRDLHILTSDRHVFTADSRFELTGRDPSDWSLKVKNIRLSDAGIYECQVNTDPKMNRKVNLQVDMNMGDSPMAMESHLSDDVVQGYKKGAITKIQGSEEQFVKRGSTVTFTCFVISTNQIISSVEWLKNGRHISFQAARGGISVDTVRTERKTTSRLTLADVRLDDSGNYTCKPSEGKTDSTILIVVEGELTQAVKRSNNLSATFSQSLLLLLSCVVVVILLQPSRSYN